MYLNETMFNKNLIQISLLFSSNKHTDEFDEFDHSHLGNLMDPYTRARTVRIGKWRWPPPKEELAEGAAAAGDQQAEGFFEFKMRKLHQKMSQSNKENSNNQGREDSFDTSEEIQSNLVFLYF